MPPPPRRPTNRKLKAPTVASAEQIRARQKGALLGLAVGEAMGIRNEKKNLSAAQFPELNEGPLQEPRGGGRFELLPGQVSWGSEMAQVLSGTLRNLRHYDVVETGKAYARWFPTAFDVDRKSTRLNSSHG